MPTVVIHCPPDLTLDRLAAALGTQALRLVSRHGGFLAIDERPVHPERHGNGHIEQRPRYHGQLHGAES